MVVIPALGLLFAARHENNRNMHWAWPFKARNKCDRSETQDGPLLVDACPDFLCIGAQKAGTTWLYQQLESHPDFWMPPFKELHYLNDLGRVERAATPRRRDERDVLFLERLQKLTAEPSLSLRNYARLFEPKASLLSGDITPGYSTLTDDIIGRVVAFFPELKVIFLARDPVERAWSHLSMEVDCRQIEPFDVTDIDAVDRNLRRRGLLLRSYPSAVVARWKRRVRPDLFRVFFFDDLQKNPAELRRSILLFLDADPDKPSGRRSADHNSWAGKEKLPLTNQARSHIAQFFKKELKACATQLGGPARLWPARYGFSLLWLIIDLLDDFDLFFWCNWVG